MKNLGVIIGAIIVLLSMYGICSFIAYDFNPKEWSAFVRFLFGIGFVYLIFRVIESWKKY